MSVVRRARALGLRIEVADLGDWSSRAPLAEYDAAARVVRVSERRLREMSGAARRRFLVEAIAHELYHHLECIGEVARIRDRARREEAARRFAREAIS